MHSLYYALVGLTSIQFVLVGFILEQRRKIKAYHQALFSGLPTPASRLDAATAQSIDEVMTKPILEALRQNTTTLVEVIGRKSSAE